MKFVFDITTQHDGVIAARSIPGNLIGLAETPEKAQDQVVSLLKAAKRHNLDPASWWTQAWDYALPHDEDLFRTQEGVNV